MDLDSDGQRDVISGSWPGRIYWFRAGANGSFARGRSLRHEDGAEIEPGRASAVFAADWDGDGDLDLLVGNISGDVQFLPRLDGDGAPVFGQPVPVQVGGKPLSVGNDAGPVVADWDGDGRNDLLVGDGYGAVQWFRDTSTKGPPVLGPAQTLIPRPTPNAGRDAAPGRGSRAKICATDWNGDGHLDLLVGEFGSHPTARRPSVSADKGNDLRAAHKALGEQIAAASKAQPGEDAVAREARLVHRDALCAKWVILDQEISLQSVQWLGRVWLFQRRTATEK